MSILGGMLKLDKSLFLARTARGNVSCCWEDTCEDIGHLYGRAWSRWLLSSSACTDVMLSGFTAKLLQISG